MRPAVAGSGAVAFGVVRSNTAQEQWHTLQIFSYARIKPSIPQNKGWPSTSPGGTTVGSQGRKPLDHGILDQQSSGGAADRGRCLSSLRDLSARLFAFQGLAPLATNLGSSGAEIRNAYDHSNINDTRLCLKTPKEPQASACANIRAGQNRRLLEKIRVLHHRAKRWI